MKWFTHDFHIATNGKGMYPITDQVRDQLQSWGVRDGMCFLFIPHTSASLTMSESYDPSSRKDVEEYFEQAVPEREPWYQHTLEGSDDSPSHIRTTLTQPSLSIPIDGGALALGTWQGIFLFEHRAHRHQRTVRLRCMDVS